MIHFDAATELALAEKIGEGDAGAHRDELAKFEPSRFAVVERFEKKLRKDELALCTWSQRRATARTLLMSDMVFSECAPCSYVSLAFAAASVKS